MTDKTLICRACGQESTFTASEQRLFAQKSFTNEPSRCPACRAARKGNRGDSGFNARVDRQMFPAVCAQYGKGTQVPFKPRGDRPVHRSACYSAQHPGDFSSSSRRGARSW